MMPLHRPVIERVVTQHAEDAAVLRATRATLVRSPHVELHRLARHDERLYAHLDGLQVAGDEGHRIAQTALESPESARSSSSPSPPSITRTAPKSIACWRWSASFPTPNAPWHPPAAGCRRPRYAA